MEVTQEQSTQVATQTLEEISAATKHAFVSKEEMMRPAVPGAVPDKDNNNAAPASEPAVPAAEIKPAQVPAAEPAKPTPQSVNVDEMSDEDKDALVAKLTKGKFKKISDLTPPVQKTKEELAAEEEKEKTDSLGWAITSGKVTAKAYEEAMAEKSKSNREIALAIFANELKEINDKFTPEEIEEQFKDYYLEDGDETTTGRQLRLKEMNRLAENYKKEKSGFLDTILPDYKSSKSLEANKELIGQRIDEAFEAFVPKITTASKYVGASGEEVSFDVEFAPDEQEIKAVRKEVRKSMTNMLSTLGVEAKDIDPTLINNEINNVLKSRQFDKAIAHVAAESAKKAKMDTEAYYKTIPNRTPNFNTANQAATVRKFREFSAEEKARIHGN
jgi:hypothetical protein